MTISITHNKEAKQFTAMVDNDMALLEYSVLPDGKTLDFKRTFVPPQLRGRHIGQDLVKFALDYAKQNNFKVIASCPFVEYFMEKNL